MKNMYLVSGRMVAEYGEKVVCLGVFDSFELAQKAALEAPVLFSDGHGSFDMAYRVDCLQLNQVLESVGLELGGVIE